MNHSAHLRIYPGYQRTHYLGSRLRNSDPEVEKTDFPRRLLEVTCDARMRAENKILRIIHGNKMTRDLDPNQEIQPHFTWVLVCTDLYSDEGAWTDVQGQSRFLVFCSQSRLRSKDLVKRDLMEPLWRSVKGHESQGKRQTTWIAMPGSSRPKSERRRSDLDEPANSRQQRLIFPCDSRQGRESPID
jgi:hypothetical protein